MRRRWLYRGRDAALLQDPQVLMSLKKSAECVAVSAIPELLYNP